MAKTTVEKARYAKRFPLTPRQAEVLAAIAEFIEANPFPPTTRDLCDRFHMWPSPMNQHIAALERKGYIERRKRLARSIRVLRKPDGTPYTGGR